MKATFVVANGETVIEKVFEYTSEFKDKHSREKYWPHITLGAGEKPPRLIRSLPMRFRADKIILCQLGNFCTCRKILAEFLLKN